MPIPVLDVKTFGFAARETMHAIYYVLWEEEGGETLTVQSPAGSEAHEGVCALYVASGMWENGPGGSLLHGVVVGFVDLGVLAKL